ncbi:GSCFA domain-containing protein [Maricaulaceae bacterium EIL42A08]|nr:GSCFA domain-containing protein [Maricaulaceae bacterium EIL42A08]
MRAPHPYQSLAPRNFWRTAIAERTGQSFEDLHIAKFAVRRSDCLVSFGSCFAQHVSRALIATGFGWRDFEPPPPSLPDDVARQYGCGIYSARVENIYTVAALRQWLEWAFDPTTSDETFWIDEDGRVRDPLRPLLEPEGFASAEEFFSARNLVLSALRRAVIDADVFVFTLGQTEAWVTGTPALSTRCVREHRLEPLTLSSISS